MGAASVGLSLAVMDQKTKTTQEVVPLLLTDHLQTPKLLPADCSVTRGRCLIPCHQMAAFLVHHQEGRLDKERQDWQKLSDVTDAYFSTARTHQHPALRESMKRSLCYTHHSVTLNLLSRRKERHGESFSHLCSNREVVTLQRETRSEESWVHAPFKII